MDDRKLRRAYQRIVSGLSVNRGPVVLVTLTSTRDSRTNIRESWRRVVQWFKRRGTRLIYYSALEYTRSGLAHLHILVRGGYIEAHLLRTLWQKYHGASQLDMKETYGAPKRLANYLAKYLVKAMGEDLSTGWSAAYDAGYCEPPVCCTKLRKMWSCSRDWIYQGAARVWQYGAWRLSRARHDKKLLIELWQQHLSTHSTPATFLQIVHDLAEPDYWTYRYVVECVRGNAGFHKTMAREGFPV